MRKSSFIPIFVMIAQVFSARAASATQFYALTKGQRYSQTDNAAPVQVTPPQIPYRLRALLYSTAATVASVRNTGGTTFNLTAAGDHIEYSSDYTSISGMNVQWPAGACTFSITSASDGMKNSVMNLAGDFYPVPARVSNFAEAQSILVTQPFTLTWDSLNRPANDFVFLRIEGEGNVIFQSAPIPGVVGALNGTSTSATVPANSFQEGKTYSCSLTVWRAIVRDTTTIAGANGQTAYTSETILPLRTRFAQLDVRQYGVEKRDNYEQATTAPAVRRANNPFDLIAFANGAATNSITAASFKPPTGPQFNLTGAGGDFSYSQSFASAVAMETSFGPGGYDFQLTTKNNGVRTNRINFVGDTYPGIPQIVNIDQVQFLKTAAPMTMTWTSSDAAAGDLVQLTISDGANIIYATPGIIGAQGVLNGLNRSITFAGSTLAPGKTYTGALRVFRPASVDTINYPQAVGVGGYSRITRFPIKTASGPSPKSILALPRRVGNQTEVRFNSIRGETYRIQSAQQFPAWSTLQTITAGGDETTLLLPASALNTGFYQIIAGP